METASRLALHQLEAGKWVASGYTQPNTPVDAIPTHHWHFLVPNFERSSAEGHGLAYYGIRCFSAEDYEQIMGHRFADHPRNRPQLVSDSTTSTGLPGRPGSSHLVRQELARRFAAGHVEPTLRGEATWLRAWLVREHPNAHPITVKSLENAIRQQYRQAAGKATK